MGQRLTLPERELVCDFFFFFSLSVINLSMITKFPANPVGTFWTASEMLSWLGEKRASDVLMQSVESVCGRAIITSDVGGTSKTLNVTDAVCREIEDRLR